MKTNKTHLFYLRTRYNKGPGVNRSPVGCVAWQWDGNTVKYSVSVCAPQDDFDKSKARKITQARLDAKSVRVLNNEMKNNFDVLSSIMTSLSNDKKVARSAVECANLWLEFVNSNKFLPENKVKLFIQVA